MQSSKTLDSLSDVAIRLDAVIALLQEEGAGVVAMEQLRQLRLECARPAEQLIHLTVAQARSPGMQLATIKDSVFMTAGSPLVLTPNQLHRALEFFNPDGPASESECTDEISFGVVTYHDDEKRVQHALCCWSDDSDGYLPLPNIFIPVSERRTTQVLTYEADFQVAVADLVMAHIDRMNDICAEDPAERIIESFRSQFWPHFDIYLERKFPGREADLFGATKASATQG